MIGNLKVKVLSQKLLSIIVNISLFQKNILDIEKRNN